MSKKIINKKINLSLLVLVIVLGIVAVGESDSAFSDSEKIVGNKVTTGEWTEENGSAKADYGDVIINEIHWASSPASNKDQWIELFNTTDEDISLKDWVIENAGQPKKGLKITANPTIKAGDHLLITKRKDNSDQSALAVSSDVQNASLYLNRKGYKQLVLKDANGNVIDETPEKNSPWPEGVYEEEEKYYSMQRKYNTQEKGVEEKSWYTCEPDDLSEDGGELDLMKSYWKEDYTNVMCGTPRHPNQPDEVPSLEIHSVEENENNEKEDNDNSSKKKQDENKGNDENKKDEEEVDNKELDRSEEDETAEGEDNHKDDNPSEEKSGDNRSGDDEDEDLSNNADGDDVDEDDEEDADAEDDEDNAGDGEGESGDPDESEGESGDTENENNNKDDNSPEDETDNDESDDDEDEDGDEVENEDDTENENN